MIKNFILFIFFFISNFRPKFSMNTNFLPEKMITYGGVVKPPGFYKIVLRDQWRSVQSAKCADVFEFVTKDIIQKDNSVVHIRMVFFNYKAEINLEEYSECYVHFYTIQTNVDGEFEIQLPNSVQETIYVHMFPLDKNKKLIRSSREPKFFLQNVLKKANWKNANEDIIFHYAERDFKISKLLSRWVSLSKNAKLSDEEAFLLKAYFRDVTEKLVTFFTSAVEMKTRELNILYSYGNSLLKCQSEGKLEKTLAQIDGMQMLVKNFCMFLSTETTNEKSGKIEEQNMQQFSSIIELKLSEWHSFCENLDKMQRSKIFANFRKNETVSKELPKTTETENKNVGKFSMNEENIFPKKMITYGGVVTPPGFFKIVVWDERSMKSAQCARLLENVMRDIPQKTGVIQIRMTLFKFVEGSNLEEFSECFKHFYTAQTNVDGQFEMQLPNSIQETIYVHMFPLDKKKRLIHSSIEPTFFLQNVMKKTNWKNGNKDVLYFYYNAIIEAKIATMLSRWASQNYQPSEDEVFLLKAYYREVTEKLVELFTNGRIMQKDELYILYSYGNSLLKWQSEGKLEKTLAQIDGMQMLVKNFCMFLSTEITNEKSGKIEEQNMQQFSSLIESKLSVWRHFCKKNLDKIPEKSKFALPNVGTASTEVTKIDGIKLKKVPKTNETDVKKVIQKATGEAGVLNSAKEVTKIDGKKLKKVPKTDETDIKKAGGTGVFHRVLPS